MSICIFVLYSSSIRRALVVTEEPKHHLHLPDRAHGKRRGFSPGAAARHSHHARAHTVFFQFFCVFCLVLQLFFHNFPNFPQYLFLSLPRFPRLACSHCSRSRSLQANGGNLGNDKIECCGAFRVKWGKSRETKKQNKKLTKIFMTLA